MKLFLKSSILIVSLILLTEVFLRVFFYDKLAYWSQFKYKPDKLVGYRYMPNSKGIFRNVAFSREYSLNSMGYPGAEYKVKKADSVFRIIVVGTSDDTGMNTNGQQNYISILNSIFKQHHQQVEILNFSIDGKDRALSHIKLMKNDCIKFKPNLILFRNEFPLVDKFRMRDSYKGIVINYANPNTNIDSARQFIDTQVLKRNFEKLILDNSFIYRSITKYFIEHQKDNEFMKILTKWLYPNIKVEIGYIRHTLDWSIYKDKRKYKPVPLSEGESIAILKTIDRELKLQNIKLLLFDTYRSSKTSFYYKLFSQNGLSYIDFNVERKPEYSFGELDGHATQEGHKAIALALYGKLQPMLKHE